MPCQSDYMEPNAQERESKTTAQLLFMISKHDLIGEFMITDVKLAVSNASDSYYGDREYLETFTQHLCKACQKLAGGRKVFSPTVLADLILKTSGDKNVFKLAEWWEKHLKADRKREEAEAKQKESEAVRQAALSKLTPEEISVLGIK